MVHFTRSCVLLGVLNGVANRGYGFSACGGDKAGLAKQPVQLSDGTQGT